MRNTIRRVWPWQREPADQLREALVTAHAALADAIQPLEVAT